jgi:hypothetical protein
VHGLRHLRNDLPITNKYGDTYVLDREWFESTLKSYYTDAFQLTEDGLPRRDVLRALGLEFVIPVLEPMRAVG